MNQQPQTIGSLCACVLDSTKNATKFAYFVEATNWTAEMTVRKGSGHISHFLGHRISSLKRRGVYLILGLLGAAFIRGGVYKRAVFIRGRRLFQEKIVF